LIWESGKTSSFTNNKTLGIGSKQQHNRVIIPTTKNMRLDDLFVPKGNNFGWTLNFENPLSWVVLILLVALIFTLTRKQLSDFINLMKAYFRK
jgi:hypothetical protein